MKKKFKCKVCGKIVIDYTSNRSKFCGRKCYHQGFVPHNKGKKGIFHHSEETKKKIRWAVTGIKNPFYGRHHTEKAKRIIGEKNKKALKGRVPWNKDKKLSKKIRRHMSLGHRGYKHPEKVKKKIAQKKKGVPRSEATKKKVSITRILSGVARGKKNPAYVHGKGRSKYGLGWNRAKKIIAKRDNCRCQSCGKKALPGREGAPHHINYNRQDNRLLNLIWSCRKCNNTFNFNRDYWFVWWCYNLKIEPEDLVQ